MATGKRGEANEAEAADVNGLSVNVKSPLATAANGLQPGWERGLEPPTPRSTICGTADVSEIDKGLPPSPSAVCTSVCTSEAENDNAGPVAAEQGQPIENGSNAEADALAGLAALIDSLSQADRLKLAKMLLGE